MTEWFGATATCKPAFASGYKLMLDDLFEWAGHFGGGSVYRQGAAASPASVYRPASVYPYGVEMNDGNQNQMRNILRELPSHFAPQHGMRGSPDMLASEVLANPIKRHALSSLLHAA